MLGKRPRPPTNLMEFTSDQSKAPATSESSSKRKQQRGGGGGGGCGPICGGGGYYRIMGVSIVPTRTTHKKDLNNSMEEPPFLKFCKLCNSELKHDRDIYMYSDSPFCTLDCRDIQIDNEKRMEKEKMKAKLASMTVAPTTSGSETSSTQAPVFFLAE